MEDNKKNFGTDAFGGPLPEKTPEEIRRDIENLLNPKPKKEKEEHNVEQPPASTQYTFKRVLMNIGEKYYVKTKFLTPNRLKNEILKFGGKKLKQKVGIRYFQREAFKSLDELATALYELGGVSSAQEGRSIIPNILNERVKYNQRELLDNKYLVITEVINIRGQKSYQICDTPYLYDVKV